MKQLAISILFSGSTLLMADGASAYAQCIGCHGVNGEKKALKKSAVITGQDSAKTVKQLKGYKAGILDQYGYGGLMKQKVAHLNDATIKAVADHIAAMK